MQSTQQHEELPALRVGDVVEVKSAQDILATLDENGEFESLPFMPEMLRHCGQRMTVHKVAHKACDTIGSTGMRKMRNAVHLTESRCDGAAHGGCQAGCLIYWKEAWLTRVGSGHDRRPRQPRPPHPVITLDELARTTTREPLPDGATRYACQATELLRATPDPLPLRDFRQYWLDVRLGNEGLPSTLRAFAIGLFNRFQSASTALLPQRLRFREGRRWGFLKGKVEGRTPTADLDLKVGERVRVKPLDSILETVDANLINRGMAFTEELALYCGREGEVVRRVEKIVDEKSGRMLDMKNPCIVVSDMVCGGRFSLNCPRQAFPFWREIWLERVDHAEEPTN